MASNNDENGNGNSGGGGGKDHHKLDKQIQKQLKERKQEMILFERFKRIATVRLESMARQSEETKVKFSMGDSEKQGACFIYKRTNSTAYERFFRT